MARITDPNADPNDPNLYDPEQSRDTLLGGMNGGSGIPRTPTTQAHTFEYDPANPDNPEPPPPLPPPITPPPLPPPVSTTGGNPAPPVTAPPPTGSGFPPPGGKLPPADPNGKPATGLPPVTAPNGAHILTLLNQWHMDPQTALAQYLHNGGSEGKYYAPGEHAPGDPAMIGLPDGYLVAENGQWTFHPRGPETGGAASTTAPDTPLDALSTQALMDEIKNLMGSSTEDPQLQGAVSAYDNQSERDTQHNRDALAEHFYASNNGGGLDSGGFDQAVRQNAEEGSIARSNFAGNLYAKDAAGRRQVLAQLLNMAQNKQLAGGSLGFLYAQLMAQMNRDALLTSLGGG